MVSRDIVVVGASSGGISALRQILGRLPAGLHAAIFVVVHRSGRGLPSGTLPAWASWRDPLEAVVGTAGRLPAETAADRQPFRHGHIYVAPPDRHLFLENGLMRVERSPRESKTRPSIDVLFRSAAATYGRRVIGILLSGSSDDGTSGLWHIRKRGGITMVQDPSEAEYSSMPENAVHNDVVDHVLSAAGIAVKLTELTQPAPRPSSRANILIVEDEGIVAKNLAEGLKMLGYQVSGSAPSGERAIEAVTENPPDVVLMDIRLAGSMTGVDAARHIWDRFQIPIVYVTAYADEHTLSEIKTTENYGYILKPFQTEAVHAAIQLALARRDKELSLLAPP